MCYTTNREIDRRSGWVKKRTQIVNDTVLLCWYLRWISVRVQLWIEPVEQTIDKFKTEINLKPTSRDN